MLYQAIIFFLPFLIAIWKTRPPNIIFSPQLVRYHNTRKRGIIFLNIMRLPIGWKLNNKLLSLGKEVNRHLIKE